MKIQEIDQEKLSLKNDGSLEIVFIGTGSAFASTLNQTNFLIKKFFYPKLIKAYYYILIVGFFVLIYMRFGTVKKT